MKRFPLLALAAAFAGCTANVDLRYSPQNAASYVPNAENAALFVAPVDDASGGVQYSLGKVNTQYVRPMADAVREALVIEVKRMGFTVVPAAVQADAVLRGTLNSAQIWVTELGTFHYRYHAKMLVDLALENRQGRRVWTGGIEGESIGAPGAGSGPDSWSGFLNVALADAMAKLGPTLARVDLSKLHASGAAAVASPAGPAPSAGPSDVDQVPAARPSARPKDYAVVIGVGRYRKGVPPAEFADADARLVSRYLAAAGIPDSHIATLIDDEAGRSDFEKYFDKWLPNHVEPDSRVFVYYSGHGAPDSKSGDAYLVPYDGDPVYLDETAYPVKKLYAQLAKLPAKNVTLVMDSCFSGAGGRSVIAAGARPLVTVAQAEVPAKLTVITASSGEQISNGYRDKGHGLFTYYFLKGLREKGDDLRAVYDYLKPEVSGYARRELNADQEPQWRGKQ